MVSAAWRAFADEIARWHDAGRSVEFWWRDDDATRPAPALSRLLVLAAESDVPLALAVVPEGVDATLGAELGSGICVLQHGFDHGNRAAQGEKKTEFPPNEPASMALARLAAGRSRLAAVLGSRSLGVLAPPWNRLPAALVPHLTQAGLRGLSAYGARASREPAPGLIQVNTHVDIIAWRGGRGFIGEDEALALAARHLASRRSSGIDTDEPTGWLTHHACHDEGAWRFLARLFEATRGKPGVHWRSAAQIFTEIDFR